MATPEYRDGNRTHTATDDGEYDDALFNDAEDQRAGALQTQWVDLPLYTADRGGSADWVFTAPVKLTSPGLWTFTYTASADPIRIWLQGNPWWRHGAELIGARAKFGGTVNGGTCELVHWTMNYGTAASAPGNATSLATIALAGDNVFNGVNTPLKDWSGAPYTLDEDQQACLEITPPGSGTAIVYGAQLKVQYPTSPT